MIIFPAIDIKDGLCVRLRQGDFNTAQQVAPDVLTAARGFAAAGASWLHTVDLDGAKTGIPANSDLLMKIVRETGLKVQVGGGIRSMETLDTYLQKGVSRCILGSAAVRSPDFVREAVGTYGAQVAVGIDAKNRMVACDGWTSASSLDFIELAKRMEDVGVKIIIFTDISKDGLESGPNFDQLFEIQDAVSCDIIASGGVTTMSDVEILTRKGLYGAILGKALYSGKIDLRCAIAAADTFI